MSLPFLGKLRGGKLTDGKLREGMGWEGKGKEGNGGGMEENGREAKDRTAIPENKSDSTHLKSYSKNRKATDPIDHIKFNSYFTPFRHAMYRRVLQMFTSHTNIDTLFFAIL